MTETVVINQVDNSIAVVENTTASVIVAPEENSIVVLEVELQDQVVIQPNNDIVVIESGIHGKDGKDGRDGINGKDGKDGKDGLPWNPTPDVINPIIDGRITDLGLTLNDFQNRIDAAVARQEEAWNDALNDSKAEIESNLVDGLDALDTALEAAKADYNAKYTYVNNTINTELANLSTDLDNLKFENDNFNLNLNTTNLSLNTTINSLAQFKTLTNGQIDEIRNAVFTVDPQTGQVVIAAYAYTNEKFNQANIRIDGAEGSITLANQNITAVGNRVTTSEGKIALLESGIALRVTRTELNESIAGAISAISPAYSFGFFNSNEGWVAVNGSITNTVNKVSVVLGDIQNTALNYSADDNPVISMTITRTGGTGWVGDLLVTYSGGSTVTYSGVIGTVVGNAPITRILNLDSVPSYAGTVTGIRLKLGQNASDTFDIDEITIGKPSAAVTQLEGIQGQINDLGTELDGVTASLTNYVTVTKFNNEAVTLNNVNTVLDGNAGIISLKATQTLINNNNTIGKANSASTWIDAAEGNITSVITSFVNQPDGINSKLGTLTGNYNTLRSEMDLAKGTISDQVVSIGKLKLTANELNKAGIIAQLKIKQAQDKALEAGDAVSVAQNKLVALSDEFKAFATQTLQLNASYGTRLGQFDSQLVVLNKTIADDKQANALQITSLQTGINNLSSSYQQLAQSLTTEEQTRALLGTTLTAKITNDINAKATEILDVVADGDAVNAQSISALEANMNSNFATKLSVSTLIADERSASASEINSLRTEVQGNYATTSSLNSAVSNTTSTMTQYVDNKQTVYDGRYASVSRVDLVESKIDSNRASTETAVFATNQLAKKNQKDILRSLLNLAQERDRLLAQGELAALGQRQIAVEITNRALAEEKLNLIAAIGKTENTLVSSIQQVNKAVAEETSNRVSALNQLSVSTGNQINALITDLKSIQYEVNGASYTISGITQKLTNPSTGIDAINSTIASVVTGPNGLTETTNTIKGKVDHPTTGLSATYQLVQTAKSTADGAMESLTQLKNKLNTNTTGSFTEAMLNLETVMNKANEAYSRAFLGVQSVVNGKAIINGMLINGQTNTIQFQTGAFAIANLNGELAMYWNSTTEKWEYKGDMIAGTFKTANSGFRVEMTSIGDYPIWAGDGNKTETNAVFYVDRFGNVKARNTSLINPRIDLIGTTHFRVESGAPFGPNNLISWYGKKIEGVNFIESSKTIILSGLLKSNAKTYIDDLGNVYFGGTFQAGVISNSGSTTLLSTTASREIEFTSNGGLITVAISFAYGIDSYGPTTGNAASVICPVTPEFIIPSGYVHLERWNGSGWTLLGTWAIEGSRGCTNGEWSGGEVGHPNQAYRSWALASCSQTFTDSTYVTGYKKFRVRVAFNTAGYNANSSQTLSITATE